jgi:hypothetical protein
LNHFSAAAHASGELLDFLGEMLVSAVDRDPLERELNENMINKQSAPSLFRWNGVPLSGGAGGDESLPRDALFARMGARCGQLSEKPQLIHWNYESNSTSFIETGSRRYYDFI